MTWWACALCLFFFSAFSTFSFSSSYCSFVTSYNSSCRSFLYSYSFYLIASLSVRSLYNFACTVFSLSKSFFFFSSSSSYFARYNIYYSMFLAALMSYSFFSFLSYSCFSNWFLTFCIPMDISPRKNRTVFDTFGTNVNALFSAPYENVLLQM